MALKSRIFFTAQSKVTTIKHSTLSHACIHTSMHSVAVTVTPLHSLIPVSRE